MTAPTGFLGAAPDAEAAEALYDDDRDTWGFVMNLSHVWAHDAESHDELFALLRRAAATAGLTVRQRAVVVLATSAARSSSYCALAWSTKLAAELPPEAAAGVVRGDHHPPGLDDGEVALVRWARLVAGRPGATSDADVEPLRAAGFSDTAIFGLTLFAALRMAFSTVNDALGSQPDAAFGERAPAPVREAVTFGRPIAAV